MRLLPKTDNLEQDKLKMNRTMLITIIIIAITTFSFLTYKNIKQVNDTITFKDIEVETDENVINQIAAGYITLPSISADEDTIKGLIGAIAVRKRSTKGDEWSYNIRFRPVKENIKAKIVDELLFHGIVSAKNNFGGKFNVASGTIATEDLAETTIKNQLIVGFKNQSDIPFQQFKELKLTPDKDYFFIESVVVTDVTTRRFRKHTGGGKIDGMAFGSDGAIYSERDAIRTKKVVSFLPISLIDLLASEAGAGDEITKLTTKSRSELLSSNEAEKLIIALRKKAKNIAPKSIPLGKPAAILPSQLDKMKKIILINNIYPRRQSSKNLCWAATTAMLFSWHKGREIGEIEAVTSLGEIWTTHYDRNIALPREFKFSFLTAANLKYAAPQSYTPEGLISLLNDYGPIWFTIDKEFSLHATILTGVFFNQQKDEYWISYIDPAYGELKADTYVSFMRRYEAPAIQFNKQGNKVALTDEDLDIQVIHF